MVYIDVIPGSQIDLGYQGENLARTIRFDISEWRNLYGDGEVYLIVEPGRGSNPYIGVVNVVEGVVEWPITVSETAYSSRYGRYELQYRVDEVVVKSAVGNTLVHESISDEASSPPSPTPSWVEQVLDAAARAEAAADRAEGVEPGSASGARDHSTLSNRDAADQHPISAITGLEAELLMKQEIGDYVTRLDLEDEIESLERKIRADEVPTEGSRDFVQSGGVYDAIASLVTDIKGKQDTITGTPGQFVVIGEDGLLTTLALTNVSEVGA